MNKKKKIIIILLSIVGIISFTTLLVVGTFAFFGWQSEQDATVDVTVVAGIGSCTLRSDNEEFIEPTDNRNKGRVIKLNARQEVSTMAKIEWTIVVNEINGLQDATFNYEMVNSSTGVSYGSGTFENIEAGDTLTFSADEVLGYSRDYIFTLYLWIDGRFVNNNLSMADQLFDFDINCSLTVADTGTVVEEHRMMGELMSQSANSYFLRSETVTRGEVDSITFVDNVNIPTGDNIEVVDISETEGDNQVLMWYDKNGNNAGLYDIFIGTNGGLIKLNSNSSYLFSYLTNVESLDLSKFDTSSVKDMSFMFRACSGITTLDVSSWDTSSVTIMSYMFDGCSGITTLDLNGWDTSSVTTMSSMFHNCSGLTTLDISGWDTSSVTKMNYMFYGCSGITTLDLNGWDTSSVTTMSSMFIECSSLTTIYVSGLWNTSGVTNSSSMFYDCTKLVGGSGTTYSSSHTDKEYARVDGGPNSDTPGYFTSKSSSSV